MPRAPHRRVFAKLFHLLVRLAAAGLQHRPVRARRYGVHANASFRHLFSQRFSEDRETGFGLRIIEQDRAGFGRYAYRKEEIRQPVPEPPREDTWEVFPDETDMSWQFLNLEERQKEKSRRERT